MADKRARLILELADLASKPLKSFVDVWALAKTAVELFNQSMGRVVDFVKDSVREFAESERAVSRLNNALRNQGFYSEEYSKALQDQARQLSRIAAVSDEAVLETQTLLTTFGLAGDQLSRTTKAALDLSAGLGVDLHTATLLLGKAWAGETATLGRYGIKLDETLQPAEKFAQLQQVIAERFGGRAQADAETFAGKITALSLAFGDLKEKIGEDFARSSEGAVVALTNLARALEDNFNIVRMVLNPVEAMKEAMISVAPGAARFAGAVGLISKEQAALLEVMAKVNEASREQSNIQGPKAESKNAAIQAELDAEFRKQEEIAELESFGLAEESRKKIESYTLTAQQIEAMEVERMAAELHRDGQHEAARLLQKSYYIRTAKEVGMRALSDLSALQFAKNKQMAAVGKAAAISETTINTYRGATGAYAALAPIPVVGPALGAAAAAAAIAAGLMNVARISGVQLAEGGMVMSTAGGVRATMAEAGRDEVAIPLDDPRTQERLRDNFGGGSVVINVGTLVADDAGMRELARRIDEQLFSLGRRNMRVS